MDKEPYEGYPNMFTWDVGLIIDNDQELLGIYQELIQLAASDIDAADAVQDWVETYTEQILEALPRPRYSLKEMPSIITQLFGSALGQVDWLWLVKHDRAEMARQGTRLGPEEEEGEKR